MAMMAQRSALRAWEREAGALLVGVASFREWSGEVRPDTIQLFAGGSVRREPSQFVRPPACLAIVIAHSTPRIGYDRRLRRQLIPKFIPRNVGALFS